MCSRVRSSEVSALAWVTMQRLGKGAEFSCLGFPVYQDELSMRGTVLSDGWEGAARWTSMWMTLSRVPLRPNAATAVAIFLGP